MGKDRRWQERARAQREKAAKLYWKKYRRHRNREQNVKGSGGHFRQRGGHTVRIEVVAAPKNFSLLHNFEETNQFFKLLKSYLERHTPVHVEMKEVTNLTIDAILILVALIKARKHRGIDVRGSSPKSEIAAQMLNRSGFYEHFHGPHHGLKGESKGGIIQRKGRRVNPELADQLCQDTQETITGIRDNRPPIYRILLEMMGNTRQHAKPIKKKKSAASRNVEPWWVLLDCDQKEKIARFAFYDGGVGILASLQPRLQSWIPRLTRAPEDTDIIHDIMHGRNVSRTGLPFRGKGLPAISTALQQGEIKGLTIITNSVFADVPKDTYTATKSAFQGTLIYWEVSL